MSSGEEHKTVKKIGLQQLIKGDLLSTLYGALIILPWLCNGSIMIIAYIVYVVSRNAAQAELVDLFFRLSSSAMAGSLVCCVFLALRWRFINTLYSFGEEVTGKITDVFSFLSLCNIHYTYSFEGKEYEHSDVVAGYVQKSGALQPGTEIILLIDPAKPKLAIMRDAGITKA